MNTRRTIVLSALCAIACVLTGCEQIQKMTRVEPVKVSPFIEHKELLVPQEATFPFHYFYLKDNAGMYENVYIADVNTQYLRDNKNWAKLDQQMAKKIGDGIEEIAKFTKQTFRSEFANAKGKKKLNVVMSPDQPGRTLVVEIAIVAIVPTKAELNILGTAGNILLPGIGIITGKLAEGTISMECMIKDAKTHEIIAMFANTEKDQRAILNFSGMTWYNSAEKNIQKQAKTTANVFSGADYSDAKRRVIKIVEF